MQETFLSAAVLGIVQGVAEFAPISSSGHLVVVPWLLGWPEPSVAFDVMLHLGTLIAVVAYFAKDLWRIVKGVVGAADPAEVGTMRRLALFLVVGTIPGALLGKLLSDFFESAFGQPRMVGVFFLVTGVVLVVTERLSRGLRSRVAEEVTLADAAVIGLAQAAAILPGVSRSGATISAGMWMGLVRDEAARFSFLLSIPIILGAGAFKMRDMMGMALSGKALGVIAVGFAAAAVSGYLCIHFLLPYLRKRSLDAFAFYCFAAGFLTIVASILIKGR